MASQTATCADCGKQFLIIDPEQKFLQDKNLPLPKNCPTCRQMRRLRLRGERQLYRTKCQKCQKDIVVSYDPSKVKNMILCKEDFGKFYEENDPIISDPLPDL
jgi:transposase-like protein